MSRRNMGRPRKNEDVHARVIRIVAVVELVDGLSVMRVRLHDLETARTFAVEDTFRDDPELMETGERLCLAAMQKAREILRLPGYPVRVDEERPEGSPVAGHGLQSDGECSSTQPSPAAISPEANSGDGTQRGGPRL